jgi:signal transduction histidine kinase
MPIPLNILIVEDSPDDAELLLSELRRAGFDPRWKRVQTEPDLLAELQHRPDIVISDFSMPQFSGLRASVLVQESGLGIPFILVSGTVGEEVAVEAMKHGATDYLLKDRISRLGNAVERALEQHRLRLEHIRTENELRQKTALLEAQVDSTLDGILVVDGHGRKILQNQRFTDIFGIPKAIAEEQDNAAQLQFVASRVINPGQFREKILYLYAHPDAVSTDEIELVDHTLLDRYSAPVRDKAGKYYGRIWTFRDVTERRKLELELRQSQKMEAIGQLAGGVAHDFNNILAVIQLQAGLLKTEQNISSQQFDIAGEIEKAAHRAANLTRQLLLFSRKQKMQPSDLDLNDVISLVTKMLQRVLGEHIHIEVKYAPHPLFIRADVGMIDQVLMNLAVNARDAMPQGGRLVIETAAIELDELAAAQSPKARPGLFACLSVSDTGHGIPPEIMTRIFEPFFTTKEIGKGTGLGLATTFGIVEQHQGWITVDSQIGSGTTFRIYLPRLITSPAQKTAPDTTASLLPGGTETILLVEDDSTLRLSVNKVLSQLGYHVLAAATGDEALQVWHQNAAKINLLITDLVMPGGMSGEDLSRRISKQNPQLKMIFISGYSAGIVSKEFQLRDGVNFLAKPFRAAQLAQIVRETLDAKP